MAECKTCGATIEVPEGWSVGPAVRRHYWEAHLTSPFNVANRCPVLAVPSGTAGNGVPTGVQVVGHPFDEAMVFRIGAAMEALLPRPVWPALAPPSA